MVYEDIAKRLITLKNADLQLRNELIRDGNLGDGYNKEMETLHNENAVSLEEIIDAIGYPTISKVGKEANGAAWLVVQHAISKPDFMRRCAALLKEAVENNEANPINLAYLFDRIALFEERLQLYGTQFDWDENGVLSPRPFDNLIKVNQRRKSIGLITLEEQTQVIRNRAKNESQKPPVDFEKRKQLMETWKQLVGWIK